MNVEKTTHKNNNTWNKWIINTQINHSNSTYTVHQSITQSDSNEHKTRGIFHSMLFMLSRWKIVLHSMPFHTEIILCFVVWLFQISIISPLPYSFFELNTITPHCWFAVRSKRKLTAISGWVRSVNRRYEQKNWSIVPTIHPPL